MVIGITGSIASGKSLVTNYLLNKKKLAQFNVRVSSKSKFVVTLLSLRLLQDQK